MQPRVTLVYLHGLDSSGQSHKAGVLRKRLAPVPLLAPDYPAHRPAQAVARLTEVFAGLAGAIFVVGSSMGGFYGQYLARRFSFAHLYLVNPALEPWALMLPYVGTLRTTARGETYAVSSTLGEELRAFGVSNPCDGVPTTLLLNMGDEVIDYRIAAGLYRDCGRVLVYPGGDHAFAHLTEAVEVIRADLAAAAGSAHQPEWAQ